MVTTDMNELLGIVYKEPDDDEVYSKIFAGYEKESNFCKIDSFLGDCYYYDVVIFKITPVNGCMFSNYNDWNYTITGHIKYREKADNLFEQANKEKLINRIKSEIKSWYFQHIIDFTKIKKDDYYKYFEKLNKIFVEYNGAQRIVLDDSDAPYYIRNKNNTVNFNASLYIVAGYGTVINVYGESIHVDVFGYSSYMKAFDSVDVRATGNIEIDAYSNSHINTDSKEPIYAHDYSTVSAYSNSRITAYDNSKVDSNSREVKINAKDNSLIETNGSLVEAYDNSRIISNFGSTIYGYDNSSVTLKFSFAYIFDNSKVLECDKDSHYFKRGKSN